MSIVDWCVTHGITKANYYYRLRIKHVGIGPKRYPDREKIDKACELIRKTDLSMHEIAGCPGYEYDTHFYKTFRRVTGMKPLEYAVKGNDWR